VFDDGVIQQIGSPTDIYNEPQNSFVADFIGESNILNGRMIKDKLVEFAGHEFDCVDEGFGEDVEVDVVVRPEDIYIMNRLEGAQLTAKVKSCIFKGVHYEMFVDTDKGYELMIQDYNAFEPGSEVGLIIRPADIQVMHKERICNTFEAEMVSENRVKFLGEEWECEPQTGLSEGQKVKVEVNFSKVELIDHPEDGTLAGEVHFLLYKGDHYHLTIRTEDRDDIWVDTNDIWDKGDLVGINIAPKDIKIIKCDE
jgi:spermidine/putrescine transport system ATP-binding protein